jgi:hypothetical protein
MLIGKTKTSKKGNLFKQLVKQESLTLTSTEQWNNNFIGVDETNKIVIFIKLLESENQINKVNLNDLVSSRINKVTRDFKKDKKMESELQSIDLELGFRSKKPNLNLRFYDIEDNFSEDFEMKRAEKWQQLILKNSIQTNQKSTAA